MQPVAKHPRAGFRPAALRRVLSRLLVVVGCAATACAAAADAQDPPEPVFQSSLKPGSPKQIFSGAFRYESPDDGADEASVPLEAPRFEKGDYALGHGVALGNSGSSFRQKGVASWYGKPFHGRKTSSGDSFDMYAMTAAHPSLPIPSYVRVTNLANGRSAVVRINDRGPFHPGRIIDLSYAAAYKLGYVDNGHASVEVALMLPEGVAMVDPARKVPPIRRAPPAQVAAAVARPAPPAVVTEISPVSEAPQPVTAASVPVVVAPAPVAAAAVAPAARGSEPVFLQLGAFASSVNAEHFKGFVEHELQWLRSSVSVLASEGKYRLQLGPFTSALEARAIAERIASTLKLRPVVKNRD